MSGIYIPGVSLPTDGDFELWIAVKKDGSFTYNVRGGWNDGKQNAITVPNHGRLGDLDELKTKIKKEDSGYELNSFGDGMWTAFRSVYQCIDTTPTIIPTDKER